MAKFKFQQRAHLCMYCSIVDGLKASQQQEQEQHEQTKKTRRGSSYIL